MPSRDLLVLLCAASLASAGCATKRIVSASPPPSVAAPAVEENPAPPEAAPPPAAETKAEEPPPEPEPAAPEPVPATPAKKPAARPHPAPQPETAAQPKTAAPVISPQLSPNDLAAAQRNTASAISVAQKNLEATNGKHLNAAQNDLVAKVQGFISQAQSAIRSEDWVRAENLADKARVLSLELVKGI